MKKEMALFIDDSYRSLDVFRKLSRKINLKAKFTDNPYQALEFIKIYKEITTIFVDIKMPTMNGLDLIKIIKNDYKERNLNICCISSYSSKDHINKAIECGIDDYILKPVDLEIFSNKLKKYIPDVNKKDLYNKTVSIDINIIDFPIDSEFKIVSLSEIGGYINSNLEFKEGKRIKIISNDLSHIKKELDLKIIEKNDKGFFFEFFNLNYNEQRKLRAFIIK